MYTRWKQFINTVQPVLSKPCIKQAPVLSKHFQFPLMDFTCKRTSIKQAPVLCGQRPLASVPNLALSSHSFHQLHKKKYFVMDILTLSGVKIVFTPFRCHNSLFIVSKDHPRQLVWENLVTITTDRTITVVTDYASICNTFS